MQEPTTATVSLTSSSSSDVMSEILRQGTQRMLSTAIELARSNGLSEMIAELQRHRVLYQQGQPLRTPSHPPQ